MLCLPVIHLILYFQCLAMIFFNLISATFVNSLSFVVAFLFICASLTYSQLETKQQVNCLINLRVVLYLGIIVISDSSNEGEWPKNCDLFTCPLHQLSFAPGPLSLFFPFVILSHGK